MMYRPPRHGSRLLLVAGIVLLPSLQACYEYVPLTTSTPKVGELVTFEITDQGRVGLSDRFGPGLAQIEGKIVATQPDEYVLNIYRVSQVNGESTMWSGETARLLRSYLGTAKGREFSRTRTALVAATAAGVVGYIIGSGRLTGGYSGPTGDEPSPPIKPQSTKLPRVP